MKHFLLILSITVLSAVLTGCHEENDAPLQLDVTENTAPDVTRIRYFSPTLGYGIHTKEYHVYTDFSACELKLQCNNCPRIEIETGLSKPYVSSNGGNTSTEATSDETGIYVSLSEGNVVTIKFTDLEPMENPYGYFGTVTVFGKIKGEDKKCVINIARRNPRLDMLP